MKVINSIVLLTLLFSCNSQNEGEKKAAPETEAKNTSSTKCYRYANEADTIMLNVNLSGNAVTGALNYNFKEKDDNKGTIKGTMKDNLLLADYTFMSEGIQSTRQVAFKLEGNGFVEGYGESVSEKDRTVFKNPDSLTFSGATKLTEMACQ